MLLKFSFVIKKPKESPPYIFVGIKLNKVTSVQGKNCLASTYHTLNDNSICKVWEEKSKESKLG
jgi:hypothetical protein